MALTLGRSKQITDLSLDQLAYLAGKARIPEKLVLRTAKETVVRFMDLWHGENDIQSISPKTVGPVNELLGRIPLVKETDRQA